MLCAFLICSFWLVSALAIVGEQQRARDLMDRLLRIAESVEDGVDLVRHEIRDRLGGKRSLRVVAYRSYGTPRPESQAIRAHNPNVIRAFSQAWELTFRNGVLDHRIKELCRVYVSKSIECHY